MELEESSDRAPQFQVQDGEFDQFRIEICPAVLI